MSNNCITEFKLYKNIYNFEKYKSQYIFPFKFSMYITCADNNTGTIVFTIYYNF